MATTRKKREEINLEELDINQLLQETVVTFRLGRALASLGATLTGREKHDANLVYRLLSAGKKYTGKLPITAEIADKPETKKYSSKEAIEWFAEHFPKEAGPLLSRMEEEYTEPKTEIIYGLMGARDLPSKLYIETLSQILEIPFTRASILYNRIIQPHLKQQEEESRLVSLTIKAKK